MEKSIDQVFKNLDEWRHLPSYQLERRADIFFSLYLKEVLEEKFAERLKGICLNDVLIPEFPFRKGAYDAKNEKDNQSTKVDYLAVSKDHEHVFLVELKTDNASVGSNEEYLQNAKSAGFAKLLEGVLAIRKATSAKTRGKYDCLIGQLEKLELVKEEQNSNSGSTGKTIIRKKYQSSLKVDTPKIAVVMLTPTDLVTNRYKFESVTFLDFRKTVKKYEDPLSRRFLKSLEEWEKRAGT